MSIDGLRIVEALTTPAVLLTVDEVIVAANEAYALIVDRETSWLAGRPLAALSTPDNADDFADLTASLERVRATGLPDVFSIDRQADLAAEGAFLRRRWLTVSSPVLDAEGALTHLLVCPEEIPPLEAERELAEWWQRRFAEYQTTLLVQARELAAASAAEAVASRRLAVLAEIALEVAQAESAGELSDLIVEHGLATLGATGGSVSLLVESGTVVRAVISAALGEGAQRTYADLPIDGPLPACVTAATGATILLPDSAASWDFGPEMGAVVTATDCQAWASLPLMGQDGQPLGALVVAWTDPHEVLPAELEVLQALAVQCAQGLERIDARDRERAASAANARMSEVLQRSLLTAPQQPENLQVAVRYSSAAAQAQVGGDWYDSFLTADGKTMLAIGDVTGHDQDAAAVMGQLRNLLRGIAYTVTDPPGAILSTLDRAMRDLDVGAMATGVLAKISQTDDQRAAGTRLMRWSNAGHTPPLLFTAAGETRYLTAPPDLLLGLAADTDRTDHEVVLEAGCTVLLFTDGLVERRGADLDDGLRWLGEAVAEQAQLPLEEFLDRLLELVQEHADDDIAVLALRPHGGSSRPEEAGPAVIPPEYGGVAPRRSPAP